MPALASTPRAATPRACRSAEQLAAAAADVHDVGGRRQKRQVVLDAAADLALRSAEPILEADVGQRIDGAAEGLTPAARRWPEADAGAAGDPRSSSRFSARIRCSASASRCAQLGPAEAAILAVHVDRDRLQVLNEQRFEPRRARRTRGGRRRAGSRASRGHSCWPRALRFRWSTSAALNCVCVSSGGPISRQMNPRSRPFSERSIGRRAAGQDVPRPLIARERDASNGRGGPGRAGGD